MKSNTNEYFTQVLIPSNQRLWLGLAFNAGFINAGGFLACHRFVSHMTGFGTQVGMNIGLNEYLFAFEMMLAPLFFILGAGYAGMLVDRKLVKNKHPNLLRGLGVITAINLVVLAGGQIGMFGEFGEPLIFQRDFLLLFLLTFCCGLQNGLFVSITAGQIRTTHITGLCTDIGLNVVKYFTMNDGATRTKEAKKNWLRVKTILGFSVGSLISVLIFQHIHYWGFLVSSMISMTLLLYTRWIINSKILVVKDPVLEAAE